MCGKLLWSACILLSVWLTGSAVRSGRKDFYLSTTLHLPGNASRCDCRAEPPAGNWCGFLQEGCGLCMEIPWEVEGR